MGMESVKAAFLAAADGQLRLVDAAMSYLGQAQVLKLSGFRDNGLPFAIISDPFIGDPVERARQLAVDIIATHAGQPQMPPSDTTSPSGLVERIRTLRAEREQRLAAMTTDHAARVNSAAERQAAALDKLEAKLKADSDAEEVELKALEDEVNQLTNGEPA